mmetsp:Transcript_123504/g.283162  ORF Transcript_123504/g.283162 Transcript_123504/m.283162 type:complete len:284 (+) Transcript_123504:108-959(+)
MVMVARHAQRMQLGVAVHASVKRRTTWCIGDTCPVPGVIGAGSVFCAIALGGSTPLDVVERRKAAVCLANHVKMDSTIEDVALWTTELAQIVPSPRARKASLSRIALALILVSVFPVILDSGLTMGLARLAHCVLLECTPVAGGLTKACASIVPNAIWASIVRDAGIFPTVLALGAPTKCLCMLGTAAVVDSRTFARGNASSGGVPRLENHWGSALVAVPGTRWLMGPAQSARLVPTQKSSAPGQRNVKTAQRAVTRTTRVSPAVMRPQRFPSLHFTWCSAWR